MRFSTKFRLYTLLDGYLRDVVDTLFATDELKRAVDDIYNLPMLENAKFILGQMMKRGRTVEEIIETVLDLRKRGERCVVADDASTAAREPRIICSMGLRNERTQDAGPTDPAASGVPSPETQREKSQ
ncbi:MAG: hypothetical protein BWX70_01952 [Verrucomicrobia bacterium ADurb.Bin070]|nr:MAG: hypothetical protein BWX70_01952 [Verrucomicrobia bacterium ADurb.Bin070]